MRQKSGPVKEPATQVLKNIRRATRRHFSAEDRFASFWKGCAARTVSPSCVVARGSSRTSTIAGRRIFWRPARSAWLRPSQRPEM